MSGSEPVRLSGHEHFSPQDEDFMREAFKEAKLALDRGEVPIGCILVRPETGQIVARGGNETNATSDATRHAELVALQTLKDDEQLGLDLYVTIEPCIMCAEALVIVQTNRVVFGAPNEKFGGCGSVLAVNDYSTFPKDSERRGYKCSNGLGGIEAVDILKRFYMRGNDRAPHPRPDGMAQRIAKRQNKTESPDASLQSDK